jgi:hypothetical protein
MLDPENDGFEQLLRDDAYIPDDGFTQRVLERLPALPRRTDCRSLVLATACALAGVIFIFQASALAVDFAIKAPGVLSAANAAQWASIITKPLCLAGCIVVVAALGWLSIRLLAYLEEHYG